MCLGGAMLRPWAQALPGWATSAKSTLRIGLPPGAALAAGAAWPPLGSAATVAARPRITSTSPELWELDRLRTAGRLLPRHTPAVHVSPVNPAVFYEPGRPTSTIHAMTANSARKSAAR